MTGRLDAGRPASRRGAIALWAVLSSTLALAPEAEAQIPFPSEERPELPEPEPPPTTPRIVLPPPPAPAPERLASGPEAFVRGYRFVGNTAFDDAELAEVLAAYTNRRVSAADIPHIRNAITRHYIDAGYVNSGAVIPDQQIRDGIVEIDIVEGSLERIELVGSEHYREDVLRRRLARGADVPLRVSDLVREVRLLQEDRRIQRIEAELHPGSAPGRAVLEVRVEERAPYAIDIEFDNYEPPSIGSEGGRIQVLHENLLGFGDVMWVEGRLTQGLWQAETGYEIPFTPWGTVLGFRTLFNGAEVVNGPFSELDIESETYNFRISISQPLYRAPGTELSMSLLWDWRRSQTSLLGQPFSFAPGPDHGRSTVSVLRIRNDLLYRGGSQVLAFRSQVSFGLDVLGATVNPGNIPDGQFVSWLTQLQWARRYRWGVETVARVDLQLSSDPLLPLERISVGGPWSVRGYRANQLVRDQGVIGSVELRIPVWTDPEAARFVQIAPFFDIGHAWNRKRPTPSPRTLPSLGIGVRVGFASWLWGQLYWGHAFTDVPDPGGSLQDEGISFRIGMNLFELFPR